MALTLFFSPCWFIEHICYIRLLWINIRFLINWYCISCRIWKSNELKISATVESKSYCCWTILRSDDRKLALQQCSHRISFEQCYVIAQMKSSPVKITKSLLNTCFFSLLSVDLLCFIFCSVWHLKQMFSSCSQRTQKKKSAPKQSEYVPMNKQKSAKRTKYGEKR